jgi:hypothetical protein
LEKRAEQFLPGSEVCGGSGRLWGAGGRNDPNNFCTNELMNKEEKKRKSISPQSKWLSSRR